MTNARYPALAMPGQEARDPVMAYVLLAVLVIGIPLVAAALARNWRKRPWDAQMTRAVIALPALAFGLVIDLLILHIL